MEAFVTSYKGEEEGRRDMIPNITWGGGGPGGLKSVTYFFNDP